MRTLLVASSLFASLAVGGFAADSLTVTAVNRLNIARPSQTIELSAAQLAPLGVKNLQTVHVRDAAGKELLSQALDTDGDIYRVPDTVIFQADFAPGQTQQFTVVVGERHEYEVEQFKAFGRFVRERFDDFAWENDRIAHRTYGHALETWEGEPLTSSAIDIWCKRVPQMIVNDWYLADNYHADHGTGFDNYSAGRSRGNGGSGLWAADRLWTSRNFVNSRVIANGPIRVVFELEYAPFDVNGTSVAEVKRVTLDGGQNLSHHQSTYTIYSRPGRPAPQIQAAIGLKHVKGEQVDSQPKAGTFTAWTAMEKAEAGMLGLALVYAPDAYVQTVDGELDNLVVLNLAKGSTTDYWAGYFWDRTAQFPSYAAWQAYVRDFSAGLASPIEVSVSAK